ncbi:hypothetical protein NQ314_007113 [Rhamnusium bicolor]|uniref:Uncharacterized protein n=1 Tax=Rhamnusium bicolor TaxID=1586634 RepID=A0AAV8YUB9_9CUCU|nr:hypothetical protein NQ314_007113 [Rhamnusium bicolor]
MADETQNITQNGNVAPPKTEKQLAKEAAKQAKLDKLKQKLEKQQNAAPKKDKEEVSMCDPNLTYAVNSNKLLLCRRKKRKKK